MSHFSLYLCLSPSNISGATYPGVPHLLNKCLDSCTNAPNPRSDILMVNYSSDYMRMFSGLRSLCIIPLECMYYTPSRIILNAYFARVLLNYLPK